MLNAPSYEERLRMLPVGIKPTPFNLNYYKELYEKYCIKPEENLLSRMLNPFTLLDSPEDNEPLFGDGEDL